MAPTEEPGPEWNLQAHFSGVWSPWQQGGCVQLIANAALSLWHGAVGGSLL